MKNILFYSLISISTLLYFCNQKKTFLIGKWEVENIDILDTNDIKENYFGYAVINLVSDRVKFEFKEDGTFNGLNSKDRCFSSGSYTISNDDKLLTIQVKDTKYDYDIVKLNNKVQLKSRSGKYIIGLHKSN